MIKTILILFIGLYSCLNAKTLVTLLPYTTSEFSPALKQKFNIFFTLDESAKVKIDIYTPDNNLIRTLESKILSKGKHFLSWDGLDNEGVLVPNEAYSFVLYANNKEMQQTIDNRYTGGIIMDNLNTKINRDGDIVYYLSKPSRVLIRAGIRNGPMIRSILNWMPKNKGKIRQRWNMKDKKGLIDMHALDFVVSVSAFSLPDFVIITSNNNKVDYFEYIAQKHLICKKNSIEDKNEKSSAHATQCLAEHKSPYVYIEMSPIELQENNITVLKNGKRMKIKIFMKDEDALRFENSKYEVSFFIDGKFKSEEESGYMPLTWYYTPNALKKGEHILTINVSSFSGQVGLVNFKFIVR